MLDLYVDGFEIYNEDLNEFSYVPGELLHLEFSLIAISKWESKYKVPFLSQKVLTNQQFTYFVECMTINKVKDKRLYSQLKATDVKKIQEYIQDPCSATTIKNSNQSPNRDVITSELIYYWMVASEIPFECEKWNLNRLFKLISIVSIKNQPSKKMSATDLARSNTAINAARLKSLNTKG